MNALEAIHDDAVFTMAEAARLCRISVKVFRAHRDKGDIEVMVFGRRTYRFEGRAIKEFRRKFTQEKPACPYTKGTGTGSTTSRLGASDFLQARAKRLETRRSQSKRN